MSHLCGKALSLENLLDYPFICLGHETASYAFARDMFAADGLTFSPDIEAATSDQILPLVKQDLGVAFLPEAFALPALKSGEIARLTLNTPLPVRQLILARRSGQTLSIAAKAFEKMVLSCVSS